MELGEQPAFFWLILKNDERKFRKNLILQHLKPIYQGLLLKQKRNILEIAEYFSVSKYVGRTVTNYFHITIHVLRNCL